MCDQLHRKFDAMSFLGLGWGMTMASTLGIVIFRIVCSRGSQLSCFGDINASSGVVLCGEESKLKSLQKGQ